jgi:hypothetical protein
VVRRRQDPHSRESAGRALTSIDGALSSGLGSGRGGDADGGAGGGVGGSADRESGGEPGRQAAEAAVPDQGRLWHVVLSVAGRTTPLTELRSGLEQLAHDHPFLLTARYAADHAEIRYWEQARDLHDAAAIALRLWGEHRVSAKLPAWEIVGLEVVDRPTYRKRTAQGFGEAPAVLGGVHPY